jgi:hypothetical protein
MKKSKPWSKTFVLVDASGSPHSVVTVKGPISKADMAAARRMCSAYMQDLVEEKPRLVVGGKGLLKFLVEMNGGEAPEEE